MGRKFEHESVQDSQSIAAYLDALKEGFASGSLSLKDDGQELLLHPQGLIQLDIRVSRKRGRRRLDVRFTWNDDGNGATADSSPLSIEPASEEGAET